MLPKDFTETSPTWEEVCGSINRRPYQKGRVVVSHCWDLSPTLADLTSVTHSYRFSCPGWIVSPAAVVVAKEVLSGM